jgi:hypothetical protein
MFLPALSAVAAPACTERRPVRQSAPESRDHHARMARGCGWWCQFAPSAGQGARTPDYPRRQHVRSADWAKYGIRGRCRRCGAGTSAMKLTTHPGGTRVSAREVCLVLANARPYSGRQWAVFFQVHPQSVKKWKANGMMLDLWSGPTSEQWKTLKAETARQLWLDLALIEGR